MATERISVFLGIRDVQLGAVDSVHGEPAPPIGICATIRPVRARPVEEVFHGWRPEPRPSLRDSAVRNRGTPTTSPSEVQLRHDLADGSIPEQRHRDDKPDHLGGGQPAPADRRSPRGMKRLLDPALVNVALEARKPLGVEVQGVCKPRCCQKSILEGHGSLRHLHVARPS